jgi:hypothetical protein
MANNTLPHDNDHLDPELFLDFWDEVFAPPGYTMPDARPAQRLEADAAFDPLGPELPVFNFWTEVLDTSVPAVLDQEKDTGTSETELDDADDGAV